MASELNVLPLSAGKKDYSKMIFFLIINHVQKQIMAR